MDRKLIFFDIDGTLTIPGALAPSESVQEAVREARARGHGAFLCTGRNYGMMEPLMAYGFDGAIASAGGYVVCGGQVLYDHPMSHELRDKTVNTLETAGFRWVLESKTGAYGSEETFRMMLSSESADSEAARWKRAAEMSELGFCLIDKYDNAPIYKIMFIGESRDGLAKIERELGEDFYVCLQDAFGENRFIHGELINRAFDKGTGVKRICSHLHIPLADTIAFGDSMNDAAMLERAGVAVAMGNACRELKAIADIICEDAYHDGVSQELRRMGLCG